MKILPQLMGAAAVESRIENRILLVRGQRVILDKDLAEVYGVPTKVLNQSVRRNVQRFPADFMFQLTLEEGRELLRSQIVTLKTARKKPENRGRHTKYAPNVFTELGVSMLSSVLGSEQAILANISIMRTFVKLRPDYVFGRDDLSQRIQQLEWQQHEQTEQLRAVFETLQQLRDQPVEAERKRIGFPTSKALLKVLAESSDDD